MPVWFLPNAATFENYTRTIIVPAGGGILFSGPIAYTDRPAGKWTDEALLADVQEVARDFLRPLMLEVSLDGAPIPDLQQYRVRTPVFSVVLPPGGFSVVPVTAGEDPLHAAAGEGYFLLLPPLPVGKHVLQSKVEGVKPGGGRFKLTLVYNLVIREPNTPIQ
jgi:hypothetical protein